MTTYNDRVQVYASGSAYLTPAQEVVIANLKQTPNFIVSEGAYQISFNTPLLSETSSGSLDMFVFNRTTGGLEYMFKPSHVRGNVGIYGVLAIPDETVPYCFTRIVGAPPSDSYVKLVNGHPTNSYDVVWTIHKLI